MYSPRTEEVISEATCRIVESSSERKRRRVKKAGMSSAAEVLGVWSARWRIGENVWRDRNAASRVESGCEESQEAERTLKYLANIS